MDYQLPPGWKRLKNERGRIEYISPPPQIRIKSRSQLLEYQRTGKFKELDGSRIHFLQKHKSHKNQMSHSLDKSDDIDMINDLNENSASASKNNTNEDPCSGSDTFQDPVSFNDPDTDLPFVSFSNEKSNSLGELHQNTDVDEVKKLRTIEKEMCKVKDAVKLLTLNPEAPLNHDQELGKAAKILSEARAPTKKDDINLDKLKADILECTSFDSMMRLLWGNEEARVFVQQMQHAVALEEMFKIGRSYVDGPLKTFPPDVNKEFTQ